MTGVKTEDVAIYLLPFEQYPWTFEIAVAVGSKNAGRKIVGDYFDAVRVARYLLKEMRRP